MSQIPALISDLAVILISAGLVTLLFKKLKQPVVLGYIVAGILAGPSIEQIPTVTDVESIRIWADIGVIFLLFALGLDFSFKKLMKVGGTAVIGAITVVIGMMTAGYITGLSLGWGHMNSLFLGGMLSMSSTTIIFKAFDDMGLRNQRFAGVVFGILVVEDLFAVLLMVLLSTVAVSKHVEGMEMLDSVVKLGIFLLFCFVVGIYLIPSFLKKAKSFLNEETLLIVSIGLCLGMVMIATKAGFSSALGAFVMGSILAETIDAERIEHLVKPVKDLFGAIFFVSVGMLIDPQMLWEYKIPIFIITLVVMAGQICFASFGVLLSGQPIKIAIQSGFSLAQIGEFAFIIAGLGLSLNVTDQYLYPIVVAVSVITTFFTPYMIRLAEPAYKWAERIIPENWKQFLERYSSGSNTIRQKSAWNKLLKALVRIVGTYTAGFSSALGAFVMGSILAETIDAERIEHLVKPVKDLFGAIFFVSVGMLIDPQMLWEYKIPIFIITLVVMAGQICFASFGVLLSGQPIKIAIQSGFSLAQIGEFAFIIAGLGLSLNVTDQYLYPIVVAVSVITTFFTPYMIRLAEPAYKWAERIIPENWKQFLERYSSGSNTIRQKSAWNKLLKALVRIVGTYTAVCLVLIFLWLQIVTPFICKHLPGIQGNLISLILILALISPMLRAIMMKKNHSVEFQQLWNDNKYNRGPLVSLVILRILLCIGLVMLPVARLLNAALGIMLAVASAVIVLMIFSKRLKRQSILMERHFFSNLVAREVEQERKAPINQRFANHLLERDLHLADFEVKQNSPSMGKSLKELNFRQKCNVNIVTIIRGEKRINIPGGDERLYPFDKLVVVGADDDLEHFRKYLEERYKKSYAEQSNTRKEEMNMEQIIISEGSRLIGRSIIESGIRDKAACLVIGIERGSSSIKNPPPSTVFEEGDIVWIVGERDKLIQLSEGKVVTS